MNPTVRLRLLVILVWRAAPPGGERVAGRIAFVIRKGGPAVQPTSYVRKLRQDQALIFTKTPAGTTKRFRASTVRGPKSRISMMRLWVRISNCSRDFLSMCGLR